MTTSSLLALIDDTVTMDDNVALMTKVTTKKRLVYLEDKLALNA